MSKKETITVVLFGLCAVIWIFRSILGVFFREFERTPVLFVLNILCAFIWTAAFVRQYKAYHSGAHKE